MENKEKYEIDGEAFLMQMLDAAAEHFNKMGKLLELSAEAQDPDNMRYLDAAIKHASDFNISDQIDMIGAAVKMFRVSKELCEKYNLNIEEENK